MTTTRQRTRRQEIRECDCCGIVEHGELCHERLHVFRGQALCFFCINLWHRWEKELGYTFGFERFKKGKPPK